MQTVSEFLPRLSSVAVGSVWFSEDTGRIYTVTQVSGPMAYVFRDGKPDTWMEVLKYRGEAWIEGCERIG